MKKYKILDLFAGAGGFSCGLEQVPGLETVVALDFNQAAIDTFKLNHPKSICIVGDITQDKIKSKVVEASKKNQVNMIVGGPPCQGFSNKGKHLGLNDKRNFLFLEYIDIVTLLQPEVIIIENVKALISAANGYFINEIKTRFEIMGYKIHKKVLNAKNFGVPQNRERTIIVGAKNFDFQFNDMFSTIYPKVTVKDAISDLAYLNSGEGSVISEYICDPKSDYQKLLRTDSTQLFNHIATNHSELALKKLMMIPPESGKEHLPEKYKGKQKFKTTWSRLEWSNISPTIDTRFDTPSNGKNSHPVLHRAITPREAARIQSFPDKYRFLGKKTEICKQIGNAVPPLLAKAIGESLIRQSSFYLEKVKINKFEFLLGNALFCYNYFLEKGYKFDHIITDPPYLISKENNFSTMNSAVRKGVDFGQWDHNFSLSDWISDYVKLLSDNGSMIIFCSYRYISIIISELEKNDMVVKDFIEWKKTNPMPRNVNRRYVQDTEFAVWAVKKHSKWIFNKPKEIPYLRSCFTTPTVAGKERTIHPTQKSLELFKKIISIHTNENDLILDPFMGSGTTAEAAILLNRNFVGVEINKQYFDLAVERIKKYK
ncbi:MAG: DNA (cytosine-5-)-methyltransferase [Pleomorphochaeta sp.]